MMMIRGTAGANSAGVPTGSNNHFPADRCSWGYDGAYTGAGYRINTVRYYPGAGTTAITITNPILGFIGKSGRFVEISN